MNYHEELKINIHYYIRFIYKITKKFPKEELFGVTSQIRRSSMSVMLNYVEGFARRKGDNCKMYKNFLRISYGSLKESKYLLFFAQEENYISRNEYKIGLKINDKIGKMIWSIIK
jgi:four helix bundle protein